MNILQISSVPVSYPGGTEKIVWELSKALSKKNNVTILQTTLYEPTMKPKVTKKENVKIITCKNDFFLAGYGYSSAFVKKLNKIWKKFDVIHIHGYGRFTSDYSLNFFYNKKPIIFTAHGFFHSKKNNFIKNIHNLLSKNTLNKANFCTALTEIEEKEYEKRGIKKEKIKLIPNGFDFNSFKKKVSKKEILNFKRKYSITKSILYVGRIHKSKGIEFVIKAIKNVDAKLIIIGRDTGYKKYLLNLIKDLSLEDKVKFLYKQTEKSLVNAYAACDCLVLFSEWEGFGLTILEATAQGKPVVVSNMGAPPILVKNNNLGYIAKYKNTEELEKMLKLAINNKKGKQKRIQFAKKYDWKNISKLVYALYKEAKNE